MGLKDGIVYQIFPERFAIGKGATVEEKFRQGLYPEQAIPMQWNESPVSDETLGYQYFGGDLDGITEHLDYIQELGADSIYLTPIVTAPSAHKYDTLDYTLIDRGFGGQEAFDRFLGEVHRRGMKLIVDLVFSHVSHRHEYFRQAVENSTSKYKDYFLFTRYPDEYQCWQGHKSLAELNLAHPAALEELITGKNSVLRYWVRAGVDGIRLDSANDIGLSVVKEIVRVAKEENPAIYVVGEVFCYAAEWVKILDGVQSYFLYQTAYMWLKGEIASRQFSLSLNRIREDYGLDKMLSSFIMTSSHDVPRGLSKMEEDRSRLLLWLTLMFTLPGLPVVYYGDEIGMTGGFDPYNRAPMIWDESVWDTAIRERYRRLIELRRQRRELREGDIRDLTEWLDNGVAVFLRYTSDPTEFCLTVVNPTDEPRRFYLNVPHSFFFSEMELEDVLSGKRVRIYISRVEIEIDARQSAIFLPDHRCLSHYHFVKRK